MTTTTVYKHCRYDTHENCRYNDTHECHQYDCLKDLRMRVSIFFRILC
jgi:hypothetical protein